MKPTTALVKSPKDDKIMEYVPMGCAESVKLSVGIVRNMLTKPTKRGQLCSDQDAMRFMMYCRAQKLNPFEKDAFLVGFDAEEGPTFELIVAFTALLKRAESNPAYNGNRYGLILKRDDVIMDSDGAFYVDGDIILGAWSKVFRKDREHPEEARVRLGTYNKGTKFWKGDTAGMICKCARAASFRSAFPNTVGSMYLLEEVSAVHAPDLATMKRPLFKKPEATKELAAPAKPAEAAPKLGPDPDPTAEPEPEALIDQVRALMAKDKVDEPILLELLVAVGLAEEGQLLEDCPEDTLGMCLEQWPDFVRRIRDVEQQAEQPPAA